MGSNSVGRLRMSAAAIGGCAMFALVALAAHDGRVSPLHAAAAPDGQAITVSTPSETPAITKAVPTITGPAPLFAGEAPDTNPSVLNP
jgi:hypothetical protein